MKTLSVFGLVLTLSSCAVPVDEETESVEQAGQNVGKCPDTICGLNAGELANGGFFHEINLDGIANEDGYALVNAQKNSSYYRLAVTNGRITASLTIGVVGAPTFLSGSQLVGLKLRLRKASATAINYYNITIGAVGSADYWAKRTDNQPTPSIETYKFFFQGEGSQYGAFLCQNGVEFLGGDSRAMLEHHAVVFEGERIKVQTLTVDAIEPRWFNIGCAETALAKMHLNGHTYAAQAAGFWNTRLERQTFLKMITADYCGVGYPFTVGGQRLRWTDERGTMTIASTVSKVREARWSPDGAVCLNTPRVDMHPTDASREVFPEGVEEAMRYVCSRPSCPTFSTPYYLTSWNPTTTPIIYPN